MSVLDSLPPARRRQVEAFLLERLATCPWCSNEVLRTSPRGVDATGALGCFDCVTTVEGRCAICKKDVSRQQARTMDESRGLVHDRCAQDLENRGRR